MTGGAEVHEAELYVNGRALFNDAPSKRNGLIWKTRGKKTIKWNSP